MALRRKGSAPWSLTKDTGLSDAPVSGYPFVEGDEVKPVIDAGYIDAKGLWQISPSDDLAFTFQDPLQAVAPGADLEFPVNMLRHDIMILAVLANDNLNFDFIINNPTTPTGPYSPFAAVGVNGSRNWTMNSRDPAEPNILTAILKDTNEDISALWQFYKIIDLRGTQIRVLLHNNDAGVTGAISTAYMRLI